MRSISLAAGVGPGYLHDILKVEKEPTLDRLMRIADALDISMSWLLYGFDLGKKDEEVLAVFSRLSDRQRQAILDLTNPEADNDH